MTLLECVQKAKEANANYVQPNRDLQNMTFEEITNLAIHEFLMNDILVYACIVTCKQNTVLKSFVKSSLKDFAKEYGK